MNETPEKKLRRQYDLEFRADAVRLVTQGDQRVADVARQLGITTKMLSRNSMLLPNGLLSVRAMTVRPRSSD